MTDAETPELQSPRWIDLAKPAAQELAAVSGQLANAVGVTLSRATVATIGADLRQAIQWALSALASLEARRPE